MILLWFTLLFSVTNVFATQDVSFHLTFKSSSEVIDGSEANVSIESHQVVQLGEKLHFVGSSISNVEKRSLGEEVHNGRKQSSSVEKERYFVRVQRDGDLLKFEFFKNESNLGMLTLFDRPGAISILENESVLIKIERQ